ncbi:MULTISPECIES: DUF5791 family protein [unclassified Haladaptatus]|uniref:DUF5791 family protein n=1 Tax=unclassified Haladaptatus TaxID=2622732 RepID=UPI0023E8DE7D|nr:MULTISPECIES: DUF5791 family protein [unclassified Haladaptatus]
MLYDVSDEPGELSPTELRALYEAELRETISAVGIESVAAASDVDIETVEALAGGESPALTLEDAAAILACDDALPDKRTILMEVRDHLLMGMTTAILDVEAIESGLNNHLDARDIQQKVEGRAPMTLSEFAALHQFIESRKR